MTNRRSLPSHGQRVSRALQFRPGHVGGRVDSAQPVIKLRPKRPTREPWTAATWIAGDPSNLTGPITVTLPASVWKGSRIYAFLGGRTMTGFTLPAGWTMLASGTVGPSSEWPFLWAVAVIADYQATEGATFSYTGSGGALGGFELHFIRFSGFKGGTWGLVNNPADEFTGQSDLYFAQPDPTWDVWFQVTLVAASYTGLQGTIPPGFSTGAGSGAFAGYAYKWPEPYTDSFSATEFKSTFVAAVPQARGPWEYTDIGAYGTPHSKALAVGWAAP